MAKIKRLNITEIEDKLKKVINNINKETFIEELLYLYEIPKASVTRAKKNLVDGKDFIIKNRLFYREVSGDVVLAIDAIEQEILGEKSLPRYIITTDFNQFAAVDIKTRETLNISIEELPENADFFLAWNGIEKADYQAESPADRKAAERFAKLYDVVARDNPNADEHAFNLFLIRTLFLLFAEDTGIIEKGLFTNVLKTRTDEEGNNFNVVIKELFEILDVSPHNRKNTPEWLIQFPYVNGKLFGEPHADLVFSKKSRELLIEAGELLNWNEINPDILGAMIQSVASEEDRHVSGMHYTSVSNIMKVINPLFLEELVICFKDLEERFEENKIKNITEKTRRENNKLILRSLNHLLDRISQIKFLDPACGSGNFLIIVYKEIRRLEIEILILIQNIENIDLMLISRISLDQFSGVELDDFAHEVAKLSLWIAEHQMNEEMVNRIPSANAVLLPLKDSGNIIQGNSLYIDWNKIISINPDDEVYLMGNPPYLGADRLKEFQKKELDVVFDEIKRPKLDYISGWFYLTGKLISEYPNIKAALVTTNSINQGTQVEKTWSRIFKWPVQIYFAYPSFKWKNSAKDNANVIVSIIGLCSKDIQTEKIIYSDNNIKLVSNINAYLAEGADIIIKGRRTPLSDLPKLIVGSRPNDNQLLILEKDIYLKEVSANSRLSECVRKYMGGIQFTNDTTRYCIWLPTFNDYQKYQDIPLVKNRVQELKRRRVDKARKISDKKKKKDMLELSEESYKFQNIRDEESIGWFIPQASSGAREYIPMDFIDSRTVVADPNFVLYNPEFWQIALLLSKMHMIWLDTAAGKLKSDYRYSNELVYNTFPIRKMSSQRKNELKRIVLEILELREYEGGTLGELYNKETMPDSLKRKHEELNGVVDRAYQQKEFKSDDERLSVLLKLYQEMLEQ